MASSQLRALGKTGAQVEIFSLGGEGVLRTHGRERDAVPVILEALRLGVRYCDTAPAYAQSQDYYGVAFQQAGKEARDRVFLASKTHERDRDGAQRPERGIPVAGDQLAGADRGAEEDDRSRPQRIRKGAVGHRRPMSRG